MTASTVLPQSPSARNRGALETSRVLQAELKARINGEVRFDRTSRMLYSTDASNYQIEPVGVVIPRSMDDAIGAIELAASHGVPILPRGGGSSLAGQTVGAALVIDFSKYLSRIHDLNVEEADRAGRAGTQSRESERAAQGEQADVRPGSVVQQPRDHRRSDRQQLDRRAFDSLRHDRRQRAQRARRAGHRRGGRAEPGFGRDAGRPGRGGRSPRPVAARNSGLPRGEPRSDRARFPAPLAALDRLFAERAAQTGWRVQPGSFARFLRGHAGDRAAGAHEAGADAEADRAGAAAIRRAGAGHGSDQTHPGMRSVRGRADGPDADRSHPRATGLCQPHLVHRRRSGRGCCASSSMANPRPSWSPSATSWKRI